MSYTVDYSRIQDRREKRAKAHADIEKFLGTKRVRAIDRILQEQMGPKPTLKQIKFCVGCVEMFTGVRGYPARVWVTSNAMTCMVIQW